MLCFISRGKVRKFIFTLQQYVYLDLEFGVYFVSELRSCFTLSFRS